MASLENQEKAILVCMTCTIPWFIIASILFTTDESWGSATLQFAQDRFLHPQHVLLFLAVTLVGLSSLVLHAKRLEICQGFNDVEYHFVLLPMLGMFGTAMWSLLSAALLASGNSSVWSWINAIFAWLSMAALIVWCIVYCSKCGQRRCCGTPSLAENAAEDAV